MISIAHTIAFVRSRIAHTLLSARSRIAHTNCFRASHSTHIMIPMIVRLSSIACIALALLVAVTADLHFNPLGRSRAYQRRRVINWSCLGAAYALFYMARYTVVVVNTAHVRALLGVTEAQYGVVLLCGFWSYGCMQVVNGIALDRTGGKAGMILGARGCGGCCLAAGGVLWALGEASGALSWPYLACAALAVFNVCNMGFNTLGSLSVIKVNVAWCVRDEKRRRRSRRLPPRGSDNSARRAFFVVFARLTRVYDCRNAPSSSPSSPTRQVCVVGRRCAPPPVSPPKQGTPNASAASSRRSLV